MPEPAARRRQAPWLAIIVISLLVVMGLIAFVERDGSRTTPDAEVSVPQDLPEEAPINPNPNPGAPVPQQSPEQRL